MTTKPEYIKFVVADNGSRKTRIVEVRTVSSDAMLGTIAWYPRWRQYTFHPWEATLFNPDCMRQIAAQCASMTTEHMQALREARVKL